MNSAFTSFEHRIVQVVAACTVACVLAFGGPAQAQVDKPAAKRPYVSLMDIDEFPTTTGEYGRKAKRIVWARCLSVEVRELGLAIVETYFEFEILETVKGTFANGHRPGARFIIVTPVGEAGESRSESQPPFPKFEPGDEAVLLVGRSRQRSPGAVISPTQSTYRVWTDARGRKTVTPKPTGMTLYRAANGKAHERMPDQVPLKDFMFSLRKHVSGQ